MWPGMCRHVRVRLFMRPLVAVFGAGMFYHFKDPVMITEGRMQYLYDETGRRYLDVRALRRLPICASAIEHTYCKRPTPKAYHTHVRLQCVSMLACLKHWLFVSSQAGAGLLCRLSCGRRSFIRYSAKRTRAQSPASFPACSRASHL